VQRLGEHSPCTGAEADPPDAPEKLPPRFFIH